MGRLEQAGVASRLVRSRWRRPAGQVIADPQKLAAAGVNEDREIAQGLGRRHLHPPGQDQVRPPREIDQAGPQRSPLPDRPAKTGDGPLESRSRRERGRGSGREAGRQLPVPEENGPPVQEVDRDQGALDRQPAPGHLKADMGGLEAADHPYQAQVAEVRGQP